MRAKKSHRRRISQWIALFAFLVTLSIGLGIAAPEATIGRPTMSFPPHAFASSPGFPFDDYPLRAREGFSRWRSDEAGVGNRRGTSFLAATQPVSTFSDPPARPISPVVQIAAFFLDGSGRLTGTPRTGSGIIIKAGAEGLVLTASHVVRETTAGCGQPIDPESPMADIIIILVSKDPNKPPIPRFLAVPTDVESLQFDLTLLHIDKTFQAEETQNLDDLKKALDGLTKEEFESRFTTGLPPSLDLPVMLLGSSESVKTEISVKVRGYPVTSSLPRITVTEGSVAETRPEEGFFLVNRAFATFGNSGGAVVDMETNFLVGVLCGGEQSLVYAGEILAKGVLIDRVKALVDPPAQGIRQPPVARYYVYPTEFVPREPATFDASASFDPDPDGQITKYEWDFDRDGEIDAEGKKVTHAFADPGPKRVMLKVTDADDFTTPGTQTVFVSITEGIPGTVIQDAIDAAEPGGTVVIEPGDYLIKGSLRIEKPLTLQGAGKDGIRLFGDGEHPVILISNTANVRVEGVTVSLGRPGILVENSRSVALASITVRDNLRYGILLRRANVDILESEVARNAVDVDGRWGRGIQLSDTLRATIADNTISENDDAGIGLFNASVEIQNNTIHGNRSEGLSIENNSIAKMSDNLVEENMIAGIFIMNAEAKIEGGKITRTKQDANFDFGYGIEAREGAYVTLAGSTVFDNIVGLTLSDDTLAEIKGNSVISQYFLGIKAGGDAQVTLSNSQVSGNGLSGIRMEGSAQLTISNSQISGNSLLGLGDGILMSDSAQATIDNSQISGNTSGISMWGESTQTTINNSTVSGNEFDGISIRGSLTQATIANSQISGNRNGIYIKPDLMGSVQVTLIRNRIMENNECGVKAAKGLSRLDYYFIFGWENTFSGNKTNACGTDARRLSRSLPSKPHSRAQVAVPQDVPTIQGAIDLVQDGGTVTVNSGTYEETLEIFNLNLTLEGTSADQVILSSENQGSIIVIVTREAKKIQLKGITVSSSLDYSIFVGGLAQATISNSQISGNRDRGIIIKGSAQAIITNSQISGNEGVGIFMWESTQVTIANSQISGNEQYGIWMGGSAQATITNSTISENEEGIILWYSAQAEITNSTISGNEDEGILLWDSAQATIVGNTIISNEGYGVALYQHPCNVTAEVFTGHVSGRANTIPGPGEPDGNKEGAVCPEELSFLMTEEGGEYP